MLYVKRTRDLTVDDFSTIEAYVVARTTLRYALNGHEPICGLETVLAPAPCTWRAHRRLSPEQKKDLQDQLDKGVIVCLKKDPFIPALTRTETSSDTAPWEVNRTWHSPPFVVSALEYIVQKNMRNTYNISQYIKIHQKISDTPHTENTTINLKKIRFDIQIKTKSQYGEILTQLPYKATLENGKDMTGETDKHGLTQLLGFSEKPQKIILTCKNNWLIRDA